MSRLSVPLCATILLATVLSSCSGTKEPPQPPPPDASKKAFNVILVSLDTLRADKLGCYGYKERSSSPNLDALAKDGILFENFITASPWTTPTHLSMLTSLHPSSHGLTTSFIEMWKGLFGSGEDRAFYKLPEDRITLAEALKHAGYTTGAFTAGGPMEPSLGFDQGFESYDTSMYKLYDENVGRMLDWVKGSKGKRFFLFWHHFEIHAPYLQTEFVADSLEKGRVEPIKKELKRLASTPLSKVWPGGASAQRRRQLALLKAHVSFNKKVCEALYVSGVHSADRWLGELVTTLKKSGLYDDTMLIVTSDHGDSFAERNSKHFYNKHGHIVYEEMIHVPLVIKLPEQYAAGARVKDVASTVDIMPTILDFLKVNPEKNEMQGRSLATHWNPETRKKVVDAKAFTECTVGHTEKKSVRTGTHKFIFSISGDHVKAHGRSSLPEKPSRVELYDLKKDPKERKNLLAENSDSHAWKTAQVLETDLREHMASQKGSAEKTTLDEDTLKKLEGLGYLGDHPAPATKTPPTNPADSGAAPAPSSHP